MALVHELIRQHKKELTLYGWNNGIDFDMLIGCGLVKEAQSSYVGMANVGLAKNFRRAMQEHSIRFIEQSETTAIDKFRAGATGLSFAVSKAPLHNGMRVNEEYFKDIVCPFTGEKYVAMEAYHPDVAIMHAHRADKYGNVQLDPKRMMDNETDLLLVKSAKKVIVSEESIVDAPNLTVLPRLFVDYVVEAPYGAHPTGIYKYYDFDKAHLDHYARAGRDPEQIKAYLDEYVYGTKNEMEYLNKIGLKKLMDLRADSHSGISLRNRGEL